MLGELDPEVTDIWIVCHGFGQLAREFITEFSVIAEKGRVVVAPEALSRFYKVPGTVHGPDTPVGATWMTREDRDNEIEDYVGYLDRLAADVRSRVSPDARLTVLGFSQGAATVSRWVARGSVKADRVILWGGVLPPEFQTDELLGGLRGHSVVMVMGDSDRYFSPAAIEAESSRWARLGIGAQVVRFKGGHVLDARVLASMVDG